MAFSIALGGSIYRTRWLYHPHRWLNLFAILNPQGWPQKLGNGTVAEAIMDRIVHNSIQLLIDGEISMRERHGIRN